MDFEVLILINFNFVSSDFQVRQANMILKFVPRGPGFFLRRQLASQIYPSINYYFKKNQ